MLCIADALPLSGLASLVSAAGLAIEEQEDCRDATLGFLKSIDQRLLMARVAQAVGKLPLEGVDLRAARDLLSQVRDLVAEGGLSYGFVIGRHPNA